MGLNVKIQDLDHNILAWNKGVEQMSGWSEAEALKISIRELIPKGKFKELESFTKKLKKRQKPIGV